jgi:hypothetical protein
MSAWVWAVIVIAVVVVVLGAIWGLTQRRRTDRLRQGFGPEYDRTVDRVGDRSAAEADLLDRERRHDELELRPLEAGARQRFLDDWQTTQAAFVDNPANAVGEADRLIQRAMRERGYPVEDFEARAGLVSVDHPLVVERYRRAHAVAAPASVGTATTESLRQAIQDYRALFVEIVEDGDVPAAQPTARTRA